MGTKLKRKSDWVGRKVRLLRKIENNGGSIFPAGTIMIVHRNYGGLRLKMEPQECEHCGLGFRYRTVTKISELDVELLEEGA